MPDKRDRLETLQEGAAPVYAVHTSTNAGALQEATLSLRISDLQPVKGTWRFRDREFVEITELPDAAPEEIAPRGEAAPPPVEAVESASKPQAAVGPSEELNVIAALHRIDADLGEPVEITRTATAIIVNYASEIPQRRDELRAALQGLAGVQLHFSPLPAGTRHPSLGPSTPLGDFVDGALNTSDAIMAHAFALRLLAAHFAPAVESQLTAEDRAVLTRIRGEHLVSMTNSAQDLIRRLAAGSPSISVGGPAGPVNPAGNWQEAAQMTFEAARNVDRLLNGMLAGGAGDESTRIAAALERLQAELQRSRRLDGAQP